MGFVKTPDEMQALADVQSNVWFYSEHFSVTVESDEDFLRSVTPEPLEVNGRNVTIAANRSQSSCVGDAMGTVIYVPVRHGGIEGSYMLAIYYRPEAAIQVFSRSRRRSVFSSVI